jgi:hypothetical protein
LLVNDGTALSTYNKHITLGELLEAVFSVVSGPRLYRELPLAVAVRLITETELSEVFQCHQTVKYGQEPRGLGTKNHCAGEGHQQFSSQSVAVSITIMPVRARDVHREPLNSQ